MKQRILSWVNARQGTKLTQSQDPVNEVYEWTEGTAQSVTLIFPANDNDHAVLSIGINIDQSVRIQINGLQSGDKKNVIGSILREMAQTSLVAYNVHLDSTQTPDKVLFTANIYEGGLNQNYFMDKTVALRSQALRFLNFVSSLF
ncbi:MAG: DUF2299 family protein [Candidatus Heimdallarchaeota archaeon]|nr:DUF2299 family protein [Candidatus Heimdallarchaeota archaeon]